MLRQAQCAQTVREAGMDGARINEMRLTQLPDSPQALEGRAVDAGNLKPVEGNIPMDRIGKDLGWLQHCFGQTPGCRFPLGLAQTPIRHSGSMEKREVPLSVPATPAAVIAQP